MIKQASTNDLPIILWVAKPLVTEIGYINPAALREAIGRGQLLVDEQTGAFCHYRTRRDGVSVVYEIAVPLRHRGRGIGKSLIELVPRPIELKCPADNPSNRFYERIGFKLIEMKYGKKQRLNLWRLDQ